MPCDPQCPVKELNKRLKHMKEEKIATLQQILEEENLHSKPFSRRKRKIQSQLVQAMTEIASLTDELALGCDSCRANNVN